jgi:hypothetical protein
MPCVEPQMPSGVEQNGGGFQQGLEWHVEPSDAARRWALHGFHRHFVLHRQGVDPSDAVMAPGRARVLNAERLQRAGEPSDATRR